MSAAILIAVDQKLINQLEFAPAAMRKDNKRVKNADQSIIWRSAKGEVIACVEKNKVLQENLIEIRQVCQDALDDAVLMGCDDRQVRSVLVELINKLDNSYPPRD